MKKATKRAAVRATTKHARMAAPAQPKQPKAEYALNPQVLKLGTLAPKDESRFTLNGILIDKDHAVVTDGHLLAKVNLPKVRLDEVPTIRGMKVAREWNPFVLPTAMASEALKALPKKPSLPILANAFVGEGDDKHVEIGVTDASRPKVIADKRPDGTYPDWQRVCPQDKPDYEIVVNAALLKRMLEYAIAFHDTVHTAPVKLGFWKHAKNPNSGKYEPKGFTVEADNTETGQHLYGLVMPMREPESNMAPSFVALGSVNDPKQHIAGPIVPVKGKPPAIERPAVEIHEPKVTMRPVWPPSGPTPAAPAAKKPVTPARPSKSLTSADDPRYQGMTAQERAWISIRHNKGKHKQGEEKICPLCAQSASQTASTSSAALRRRK